MRTAVLALLLLSAAFAGCLSAKDGGDDGGDPTSSGSKSGTATGSGTKSGSASKTATGTTVSPATPKVANLTASAVNGTAPLLVNFTANATAGFTSWRLSFGDGASANGTTLPATVNHTYAVGGNFSANLTVTYSPGITANASVPLQVAVEDTASPPDVLTFTFADSLGCLGEDGAGTDQCLSFQGGPEANGIDGYWQALDERYWGLSFTTTVDQVQPAVNDSDCAFTDASFAILGFASNSNMPCQGTVPEGTAWIFLFPFALPALEQTITFTV